MKYEACNPVALDKTVEILFGANMVPTFARVCHVLESTLRNAYDQGVASVAAPLPQRSATNEPQDQGARLIQKDPNVVPMTPRDLYQAQMNSDRLGREELDTTIQHDSGDEMDFA